MPKKIKSYLEPDKWLSLTPKQLEALRCLAKTDWLVSGYSIHPTVAAKLYALGLVERRIFRPDNHTGGWGVPTCCRITPRGRRLVDQQSE